MTPILPSNEGKDLGKNYLSGKFVGSSNNSQQFKADAPSFKSGSLKVASYRGESSYPNPFFVPLEWYELYYNGSTLKYTMDLFGQQPDTGYPLFIMLHGGGSSDTKDDSYKSVNNRAWYDMAGADSTYYRASVAARVRGKATGAMYIAARGITVDDREAPDAWDLHFPPNSYVLFTKLLRQLIRSDLFKVEDAQRIRKGVTQLIHHMHSRISRSTSSIPSGFILWASTLVTMGFISSQHV